MKNYKGKKNFFALKIEMSKAFDRLEWRFISQSMLAFGYDNDTIKLIMGYITDVSFFVNINGLPDGNLKSSRGIRQECPLSPFLFILAMEILSKQLFQAENMRLISDISIGHHV